MTKSETKPERHLLSRNTVRYASSYKEISWSYKSINQLETIHLIHNPSSPRRPTSSRTASHQRTSQSSGSIPWKGNRKGRSMELYLLSSSTGMHSLSQLYRL